MGYSCGCLSTNERRLWPLYHSHSYSNREWSVYLFSLYLILFIPSHLPPIAAGCFHYNRSNQCNQDKHLQNTAVCLGSQWKGHWANRSCHWRWWSSTCRPCLLVQSEDSGPSLSRTSSEHCGKKLVSDHRGWGERILHLESHKSLIDNICFFPLQLHNDCKRSQTIF